MLWQANLSQIMVESVPLEQTIYLSSKEAGPAGAQAAPKAGYTYEGAEIHGDLGQAAGIQGLHQDTFDDWEAPESMANVPAIYAALKPAMDSAPARFRAMGEDEHATDWRRKGPDLRPLLPMLHPSEPTAKATPHPRAT